MIRTLLLGLTLLATANIQMGDNISAGDEFARIVQKAAIRLQVTIEKRPLKIKSWNDSLIKTAAAARLMASGGNPEQIAALLKDARRDYEKNSFAYLLEAVMANSLGREEEANWLFEQFLLKSRTFSEFEETFLHWGEFHRLRRTVYELLKSRGITFKGREKEIHVRVPYEAFFRYVMDPSRDDWILNLFFVVMIIGGGVALIITSLNGVEWTTSRAGTLLILYLIVWIAYGLWIFDLAFGLPFGWKRKIVVPLFFGVSLGIMVLCEFFVYWHEKKRPLEEGYRRCPHCKAVIVELAVECPECRKKI